MTRRNLPAIVIAIIAVGLFGYFLANRTHQLDKEPVENGGTEPQVGQPVVLTLYFGNQDASGVAPEERTVTRRAEPMEELIIRELIKGPRTDLNKTIPDGTKLLSIEVKDAVAYVNFSKEFQTNHWGGSAGETITLYSVVNSLTELSYIDSVQFLIEGKKVESLAGHWSIDEPIERDESLIIP